MKIIIIGAGLLGVTTAYYLNLNGHNVTVVDRQTGVGMETSFANAGFITPSMAVPWNPPGIASTILKSLVNKDLPMILNLRVLPDLLSWGLDFLKCSKEESYKHSIRKNAAITNYSLAMLRHFREENSIEYDALSKGTLKIYRNQENFNKAAEFLEFVKQYNVTSEILNIEKSIQLEPLLQDIRDDIVGSVYFPNDEIGDAHKFCVHLAAIAKANGVKFKLGKTVHRIKEKNGIVDSMVLNDETFSADAYVLAAGSYTPLLAKDIKLKIPIKPIKGYSLTTAIGQWEKAPQIPLVDNKLHAVVTPMGDNLRVVSIAELTGYDLSIQSSRIQYLVEFLKQIYPSYIPYFHYENIKPWAGLRPVTPDGVPIIGDTRLENLYINSGHGHLGWTMAMGAGKLLADYLSGNALEIDIKDYQLSRFN